VCFSTPKRTRWLYKARCEELDKRYAPTLVEKIDLRSRVSRSDLVADLLVVCAGQQTDKSLLDSANEQIRCGKGNWRTSGK
jgi:hypothetical protein